MEHLCLADIAGPLYDPEKPFRNWSAVPYYQLDTPEHPFVDERQLAWGVARAHRYLAAIRAQGYNGIVVDNLAHLVDFSHAPVRIYAPDSPFAERARRYRAAFGPLFAEAAALGMQVFVTTDMQWSTPPLRAYVGRVAPDNPRLAEVNRWALDELFRAMPEVAGVFVRFGEAGGAHDQGQDYQGHMCYTTAAELRALVGSLLPACEAAGRLLVVRTWSIGIGELGDLLWSPARYRAVFEGLRSPALLTSVKHVPMDFFRHLPHNPTLGLPGPRQIVELQNRREYELFGMAPSGVARLHRAALARASGGAGFAGVWAWNSSGGWGGGRAALGEEGWSLWTELSSAVTAALLADPGADAEALVRSLCAARLGGELGEAAADLYLDSEGLIESGWYLHPLDRSAGRLGPLVLPTLLWCWWMRPTASLVIWAYLASAASDPQAVARAGAGAAARADAHAARLRALAPPGHPAAEGAAYLAEVLGVAQALRGHMLALMGAAQRGDRRAWRAQARRSAELRGLLAEHSRRRAGDRDYTPLELGEVERFLRALERSPDRIWPQARLAVRAVGLLRAGRISRRGVYVAGGLGAAALSALLLWRSRRGAGLVGALASGMLVPAVRRRALGRAIPWLSRRYHILPSIFFETGPSFTEWAG